MDLGLKGKTALVLGGGGGLGRAIAKSLAAEGANVAVAGIGSTSIDGTVAELKAIGGRYLGLIWDLADLSVINANVSKVESELGPIDILVNNTGGPPPPLRLVKIPRSGPNNFKRWFSPSSPSPIAFSPV